MIPDFFDRTLFQWTGYILLLSGFILALIIQFGFYFKLLFLKRTKESIVERPISVLMSIRNEEGRIEKILLQLLDQNYANFEVIVVDDFSEDATLTIVGVMARKYPKLKFSSLNQETRFSEKMAINLALKAAHSDWVIFITPETDVIDPLFLRKINDEITDSSIIALNYINYLPQNGFYNRLCRVERFYSFLTSSAYSSCGVSLFFQQTNVLFRKQAYFETGGFKGKMNAYFASLELLFNRMKKMKVQVSFDTESQLREKADLKKSDFIELIRKQILLRRDLSWIKKVILSFEDLSKLLIATGFIWLLVTEYQNWFIFSVPVVLILISHIFMVKTLLNRLNERKILVSSLVYVFFKPVLIVFHRILIYIQVQRNKWN